MVSHRLVNRSSGKILKLHCKQTQLACSRTGLARLNFKGPDNFKESGRRSSIWGSAPEPDETKPKTPGAVPTNRHKPIPNDFGPVSGCFDHDPKL